MATDARIAQNVVEVTLSQTDASARIAQAVTEVTLSQTDASTRAYQVVVEVTRTKGAAIGSSTGIKHLIGIS
jgi:hypothetical protein